METPAGRGGDGTGRAAPAQDTHRPAQRPRSGGRGGGPGRQTRPRPPLATGRGRGRGGAGEGVGGFAGVGRVWLPALITGKAERGGSRGSQAGLESEPQNQEDLGGRLSGAIQDSRSNEHGQHASLNPWALPPAVLGRAATLRGDKIRFQKWSWQTGRMFWKSRMLLRRTCEVRRRRWLQKCRTRDSRAGRSSVKKSQEVIVNCRLSVTRHARGCSSTSNRE